MERKAALRLISLFQVAHDAYVYRGARTPEERVAIEENYQAKKAKLLEELTKK